MKKSKKISAVAMAALLTASSSNSLEFNMDSLSSLAGEYASGLNFSSISGIPGLGAPSVKCSNPLDLSKYLSRINGACSALDGIVNKLSGKIGPCSIDAAAGDCYKKSLINQCNSLKGKILTGAKGKERVIMSPISAIGLSTKNSILTGGDIVMSGQGVSCSSKINKMTEGIKYGVIGEESVANGTSIKDMPGFGAFDRNVEMARDCIKSAGLGGAGLSAAKEMCIKNKSFGLPQSKAEANNAVAETASKQLSSPSTGMVRSMASTEAALNKTMKASCDNTSDPKACEENVASTKKEMQSIVVNTELMKARQLKIMEDAAMGPNLVVHFDDNTIEALPVGVRSEYASAAKRQMSFMTAYRYLANEDAAIDKEMAIVVGRKMEESARPFYEKNAIKDIEKIIGGN